MKLVHTVDKKLSLCVSNSMPWAQPDPFCPERATSFVSFRSRSSSASSTLAKVEFWWILTGPAFLAFLKEWQRYAIVTHNVPRSSKTLSDLDVWDPLRLDHPQHSSPQGSARRHTLGHDSETPGSARSPRHLALQQLDSGDSELKQVIAR